MKFDKATLTVKTGQKIHLQFHNNSKVAALPHNWVLVKPGSESKVAKFGQTCMVTTPKFDGCVMAGLKKAGADVIAYTPLAQPDKTVDVTFTAPAPGKYPYICTVPGHFMGGMHGTLDVTK